MAEDPSGSQILEPVNNLVGTPGGTMTSDDLVAAQIGDGLDFDGIDDNVIIPYNIALDVGTSDLTLSAWIRLNNITAGTKKEVINRKNGGATTVGYGFRTSGANIEVAHRATGGANTNTSSSAPIDIVASECGPTRL